MAMRTVQGKVKAADIEGVCHGMYRVSGGYDNRPVLYAVFDHTLYLINEDIGKFKTKKVINQEKT